MSRGPASSCSASRVPARARRPTRLADHYGIAHLSTGDSSRAQARQGHRVRARGQALHGHRRARPRRDRRRRGRGASRRAAVRSTDGFVLDGFPRTLHQAEELDRCSTATARPRRQPRRAHRDRARPHRRPAGVRELPARVPREHAAHVDWTCDTCGGKVVQRDDDTEEASTAGSSSTRRQTVPIIDYYRSSRAARRCRRRRRRRRGVRAPRQGPGRPLRARPAVITRKTKRADRAHAPRRARRGRDARGVHPGGQAGRDHRRSRRGGP